MIVEHYYDNVIELEQRNIMDTERIEVIGHIDDKHRLIIEQEVPLEPGEVKILVFPRRSKRYETEDDPSVADLMRLADAGGAFDFLNDPAEDIYTLEDGIPLDD